MPQADLDIVSRDARLPGLALALDVQSLSTRLGTSSLRQAYLKYKPETSCTVSVVNEAGDDFAVLAYPPERFSEVKARSQWFNGPERAILLDDVCMAIVPMQLDLRIQAASALADPDSHGRFFKRLLKQKPVAGSISSEILRYKPKRRIVSRLLLEGRPSAVLKCFNRRDFGNAERGARLCAAVSGVRLLGVDPGRQTLAMPWVDGHSLCPVLSGELHCEAFGDTGRWLGEFHACPRHTQLPFSRESRAELVMPLLRIANDFPALAPGLSTTLDQLLGQISKACTRRPLRATLIHGDFSADQVIIPQPDSTSTCTANNSPVVIDWDRALRGSPLRDVGSFLARLDHQWLTGCIDLTVARCAQEAFMQGYRERVSDTDQQLVNAFHARALLMLVAEGFRNRDVEWYRQVEVLFARVEALLTASSTGSRGAVGSDGVTAKTDAPGAAGDTSRSVPGVLAAALDPGEMHEPLMRLLAPDAEGLVLQPPRLLRHKPARRALIRYKARCSGRQLEDDSVTFLGKLRFRKPDRRTPALHDQLRACGLDENNAQGVSVPANLGRYDAMNIWFQELAPGRELSTFLKVDAETSPFRRAGAALACFHTTPISTLGRWSLHDEAGVLDRALIRACHARPDLERRINVVAGMSQRLFGSLPACVPQLIHRDFYHDQLLIDGDRVWLIDLDLCAQGDPCIDVGNFLAHLTEYSIRRFDTVAAFQAQSIAFLDGYNAQHAGSDIRRIRVLETLSLARHLYISTTFADREHTTDPLLALCEKRLGALSDSRAMKAQRKTFDNLVF